MTSAPGRITILAAIDEAVENGAGRNAAARKIGLSPKTIREWRKKPAGKDRRPEALRPASPIALSDEERDEILRVCNHPDHADLPPGQIVPRLADKGIYLASESTFYRVLKANNQAARRGKARAPAPRKAPKRHTASAPNQIWVWDITWLPSEVAGIFYKLYMVMDLYSRFIVTAEVWEEENAENSITVVQRAALSQGIAIGTNKNAPILHGDNGSPIKAATVQARLISLGITPSYSRPRVSNDNPHAESAFRTLKYHPSIPSAFTSLDQAREWTLQFVRWFNHEHLHSSLRFVTPASKHQGHDTQILQARSSLYQNARRNNPDRWIQNTPRNWTPVSSTSLHPPNAKDIERTLKKSA